MIVLGIETATAVCAASVADDDGVRSERRVVETHIHSEKLLTLVQEVCADARIELRAVDAVAVSIGPGSFTGLRIGLSAAKGLCVALECALVPVPTFDAIAEHAFAADASLMDLTVCIDARQGDYYVARFRRGAGGVQPVAAEPLGAVEWWGETGLVLTDAPAAVRKHVPSDIAVADVLAHCSAGSVAVLGLRLRASGVAASVGALEPLYLKDFVVKPLRPTA